MALPRDDSSIYPASQGIDRTPPQNIELEMSVLGGIMLEPKDAFPLVQDLLSRDSFYWEGHAVVFDVMADLHRQGIPPDSVAVLDALRGRQLLEKAGGSGVVLGMLNSVPTAANVEYHARRVSEKAYLRQLIRACTRVIEDCYRQELPLDEVLDRAESSILQLSAHSGTKEFVSISEVLRDYMDQLSVRVDELERQRAEGVTNPRVSVGLGTGFLDLDKLTGGLRPSELTIIAARPSMGKTALALNFAHHMALKEEAPVGIFSLEMGVEQLAERLLCIGTKYTSGGRVRGISTTQLLNPNLTDQEWTVLQQSYEHLSSAPIYIDDSSVLSVGALKSKVRRLHATHGVRCVIVDYLQLMTAGGYSGGDNRVQEVSEISRGLKQVARELKIPVIALSQLSRAVESRTIKKPVLSDLRESGAIEQDADVVMFIHRPDYYDEKKAEQVRTGPVDYDQFTLPEAEIIVAKNRNGPTGVAKTLFFKEITRFLDESRR
jgi:replicative DNA helicase